MRIKQYQVDAFAARVFEGNPAAVCPLDAWLDDSLLQAIAAENNLSETAFFVPEGDGFRLRWFTPVTEVDLCGHATLATAHVLYDALGYEAACIRFETRSGTLTVERTGDLLSMDFPASRAAAVTAPEELVAGLGQVPTEVRAAEDYVAVYESEEQVRAITPDHERLRQLGLRGVVVTAPGVEVDFVSRFFAPKYGIPEDPVTGSAHCILAPYWQVRLNKNPLAARQVSSRGGEVRCEVRGDRVILGGRAVTFMVGEISV